jgi:hypothetical protein
VRCFKRLRVFIKVAKVQGVSEVFPKKFKKEKEKSEMNSVNENGLPNGVWLISHACHWSKHCQKGQILQCRPID